MYLDTIYCLDTFKFRQTNDILFRTEVVDVILILLGKTSKHGHTPILLTIQDVILTILTIPKKNAKFVFRIEGNFEYDFALGQLKFIRNTLKIVALN